MNGKKGKKEEEAKETKGIYPNIFLRGERQRGMGMSAEGKGDKCGT